MWVCINSKCGLIFARAHRINNTNMSVRKIFQGIPIKMIITKQRNCIENG